MDYSQWEVIVLKPTSLFLSFLAAQLPDIELPELHLLQTDNTAYVIRKQISEEATLDEIGRLYSRMFRHEISRWLGDEARNQDEGSFLDFLCCFKFELHSNIVLMEPTLEEGRQLLCIKPRTVLINWMRSTIQDQEELTSILDRVNLSQLRENATVVVKNFEQVSEVKPFMEKHYRQIYEAELSRMCDKDEQWPLVDTFPRFNHYFAVEIHTQLVHLY